MTVLCVHNRPDTLPHKFLEQISQSIRTTIAHGRRTHISIVSLSLPFIFIYFLLLFLSLQMYPELFVIVQAGHSVYIYDDYVTCDTITRVYLLSMCGRVKLHKNREDLLPKMALSSFLFSFLRAVFVPSSSYTLHQYKKACLDCICIRNELPS